jgi:hypothetical protein
MTADKMTLDNVMINKMTVPVIISDYVCLAKMTYSKLTVAK